METNKELFERMPVPKALMSLALPTIVSQLITMVYNLADTFFIGRTGDPLKVAAVALTGSAMFLLNALANLFGIGGGSLISRLLGAGKPGDAKHVSAFSFYASIAVAALYALACGVFSDPLLRLFGASADTIGYSRQYLYWVIVVGGVPTTVAVTMSHLLRSEGYAKKASLGLGLGGVLNMVLDPLFMFVILPAGNEVTGAAAATMLSNLVSFVFFIAAFLKLRGRTVLSLAPGDARLSAKYVGQVFAIGLPSAMGTALACASNITVNNLMSGHGDIPLAAIGIVKKIDMLPSNTGMGLCQGMMPLVAYNYSAGNYDRMKSVVRCARRWGMMFAAFCIVVFELFARGCVELFINDGETVAYGAAFLRIACLAVPFMISNFQMNFTFQAMGRGLESLIFSSCRQGIINIPLLLLMDRTVGMYGIVWTQLIADVLTMGLSFVLYARVRRQLEEDERAQTLEPAENESDMS